jgi:nucleotide-binding universal stress UspA family protein
MATQAKSRLRVLWATDGSPHTENAIAFLRALILPVAAQETAQREALALEARESVSMEVTSRWGQPIQEILRAADQVEADLIVLAARGHSDLRFILLGSVAEGVVQHANCPILIARSPREKVDRVVIGFDGSPAAREAARFVGRLATPEEAEFVLAQVVEPFAILSGTPLPYRRPALEAAHEINARRHRHAERDLEAVAKLLSVGGRQVTTRVLSGHPAEMLDEMACREEADLLVVGCGRQGLGPTADKLVRHSHASVLVVH